MTDEKSKKVFWIDGDFEGGQGGIYYRAFDLVKFIEKVELNAGEVIGIRIGPDIDNKNTYSATIEIITKNRLKE